MSNGIVFDRSNSAALQKIHDIQNPQISALVGRDDLRPSSGPSYFDAVSQSKVTANSLLTGSAASRGNDSANLELDSSHIKKFIGELDGRITGSTIVPISRFPISNGLEQQSLSAEDPIMQAAQMAAEASLDPEKRKQLGKDRLDYQTDVAAYQKEQSKWEAFSTRSTMDHISPELYELMKPKQPVESLLMQQVNDRAIKLRAMAQVAVAKTMSAQDPIGFLDISSDSDLQAQFDKEVLKRLISIAEQSSHALGAPSVSLGTHSDFDPAEILGTITDGEPFLHRSADDQSMDAAIEKYFESRKHINAANLVAAIREGTEDLDGKMTGSEYKMLAKYIEENKSKLSPLALSVWNEFENTVVGAGKQGVSIEQADKLYKNLFIKAERETLIRS